MKALALALLLPLTGCAAAVGTSGMITVPRDAPLTCGRHCTDMGLSLSAVVVMANTVGCVCAPATTSAHSSQAAAATGGTAAVLMQEEKNRGQH